MHDKCKRRRKNEIETERNFVIYKKHMDVPTTMGDEKVERNENTKNSCEHFGLCSRDSKGEKEEFFHRDFLSSSCLQTKH